MKNLTKTGALIALIFFLSVGRGVAGTNPNRASNSDFTREVGHRIRVLLSGAPEGFRQALIDVDTEGLIDDIALPKTLNEADLVIFYYSTMDEFEASEFFPELKTLRDEIAAGFYSSSSALGLTVSSPNGPRPLNLFFYNELETLKNIKIRDVEPIGADSSDLECLATRIYGLSLLDDAQEMFGEIIDKCNFK